MIKIEAPEVYGFEPAIRGMRNPMNSWDRSDSYTDAPGKYILGPNDHKLAKSLADAGPVHGKYLRMIAVYADITAPLYWWKEFDTYKVGTVANSCSTMHKIHAKKFTIEDFSHEHLDSAMVSSLQSIISDLNTLRDRYNADRNKEVWYQMVQLLPSSYNQKRTVMLNYEVLRNMYISRKDHKLDEWRTFCKWVKDRLPYSELIVND